LAAEFPELPGYLLILKWRRSMGSRHLVSTPASRTVCGRCDTPLLTGWAEGILARVDAEELDRAGEIAALIEGRITYSLIAGELVDRDATRIRSPNQKGSVYAEHKCTREKVSPPKQMTIDDLIGNGASK
jgi:hypothetical protein